MDISFGGSLSIHYTPVGKNVEKLEPSYTADVNVRWYSHFGNSLAVSQKW